ncbi:hypothetical protein B0T13DRAFT_519906 [Neurospora crassa]|nr:hypothetical protein B0T13DRAFT_519906 [Neurospora crassa]
MHDPQSSICSTPSAKHNLKHDSLGSKQPHTPSATSPKHDDTVEEEEEGGGQESELSSPKFSFISWDSSYQQASTIHPPPDKMRWRWRWRWPPNPSIQFNSGNELASANREGRKEGTGVGRQLVKTMSSSYESGHPPTIDFRLTFYGLRSEPEIGGLAVPSDGPPPFSKIPKIPTGPGRLPGRRAAATATVTVVSGTERTRGINFGTKVASLNPKTPKDVRKSWGLLRGKLGTLTKEPLGKGLQDRNLQVGMSGLGLEGGCLNCWLGMGECLQVCSEFIVHHHHIAVSVCTAPKRNTSRRSSPPSVPRSSLHYTRLAIASRAAAAKPRLVIVDGDDDDDDD